MLKFTKKTRTVSRCAFLAVLILGCTSVAMINNVDDARGATDVITGTVGTSCTINSSTTDPAHTADVTPGSTVSNIGNTSVNVKCNDTNGFSVFAVGNSGDVYGSNVLSHQTESSTVIPAGDPPSSGTASSSYWAMKVTPASGRSEITSENSFNNYKAVPSSWTKVVKRAAGVEPGTSSTFSVTYQVFATATQAAGTYTGKVTYTVADPSTKECPDGYEMSDGVCKVNLCGSTKTMQSIDSTYISSMTTGTQVQMCDSRDGKLYYVAKLADNNVWMTQNLDLDLTTAGLTNADTDLNSKTTWDSSSTYAPQATETVTSESSTYTDTHSWNLGDYAYDGTTNSSCGTSATSYANCTSYGFSTTSSPTVAANHYHVGNLYQWNAATAGSGGTITSSEAQDSICPKGWRLPTSKSESSGDFQALVTAYSADSSVQTLLNAPLYFVRGGFVSSGILAFAGYYGFYWSSTATDSDIYTANALGFGDTSGVGPFSDNNSYTGFNVRCVAR